MSRTPTDTTRPGQVVEALLHDLGPRLRRGGMPDEPLSRFPTGIPDLDRLIAGGFPRGRLSEVTGPPSSGRTSLALALLARATRIGEVVAVIDGADTFDPASARAAGVLLERILWVRAASCESLPSPASSSLRAPLRGAGVEIALKSAERVLAGRGFGLLVLDLAEVEQPLPAAAAARLARAAAGTGTALVMLGARRLAGTSADLALELRPAGARFTGTPALLEALRIEIALARHRTAPAARAATVFLRATRAA